MMTIDMNNVGQVDIRQSLEFLRQELPEPFSLSGQLDIFFSQPVARQLLDGGDESVRYLLRFLQECHDPYLARVAVILLSRFSPDLFYEELRKILEKTDQAMTLAFETGLWMIRMNERRIAEDLLQIVAASDNPYPLLLLQRPVAQKVASQLAGIINQHRLPHSLYALYSYRYSASSQDTKLLTDVSHWAQPEMSSLAGLYLLKLGSKAGVPGISAGLTAEDEQVRTMTYYELTDYLPKEVFNQAHYDPKKSPDSQAAAVSLLLKGLCG